MFFNYLFQAYCGRIYWEKLKRTYGNGTAPSKYIMFADDDAEYNAWGLCFLEHFIEKEELDKVVILSTNEKILDGIKNIQHPNIHKKKISRKQMQCLVRYSALVPRNQEWMIVSVKQPYDTGAERLLGKKGVTKREIVWYDVYRMSEDIDNRIIQKAKKWDIEDDFKKYLNFPEKRENEAI